MIRKDRIYLGIKQGHFSDYTKALLYADKHTLKIELRTVGHEEHVQMRLDSKSQWMSPYQWADNYARNLRLELAATQERFNSLGLLTGDSKSGSEFTLINLDSIPAMTTKFLAGQFWNVAYHLEELGFAPKMYFHGQKYDCTPSGLAKGLEDRAIELQSGN